MELSWWENTVLQWPFDGLRVKMFPWIFIFVKHQRCFWGRSQWSTWTVSLCPLLNNQAMDLVFVTLLRKISCGPSQCCRFSYSCRSSFSVAHDRVSHSIFSVSQIQLFRLRTALCREKEHLTLNSLMNYLVKWLKTRQTFKPNPSLSVAKVRL